VSKHALFSETSVAIYKSTRHGIPDDCTFSFSPMVHLKVQRWKFYGFSFFFFLVRREIEKFLMNASVFSYQHVHVAWTDCVIPVNECNLHWPVFLNRAACLISKCLVVVFVHMYNYISNYVLPFSFFFFFFFSSSSSSSCFSSSSSGTTTPLFASFSLQNYFLPFNSVLDTVCLIICFHNP
jgi:hypothetical protein